MANRNFNRLQALEKEVKIIHAVISIGSDAEVSATSGLGLSAAKTATGTYTLTLEDYYVSCKGVQCTVEAATAVDLVPQVSAINVSSTTKTIVVKLLTGATATSPSAACKLHVALYLKNSTV